MPPKIAPLKTTNNAIFWFFSETWASVYLCHLPYLIIFSLYINFSKTICVRLRNDLV